MTAGSARLSIEYFLIRRCATPLPFRRRRTLQSVCETFS